ncbi:MAG: ATP-binding cassette domain-containing protein [Bifidobacteriaceae bacterium]|jgi:NitT/TauT family transport system ATP-binding protein|nr:ATP-binding cassette domain-containing protein [Bifidobacteriaceae bacterium]
MIALRGVGFAFGGQSVIGQVSVTVPSGGLLLVTGANGSGKTTLLRLVLGLLRPQTGTVEGVAGRRLAAVFQEDRLAPGLTAQANVRLVLRGRRRGSGEPSGGAAFLVRETLLAAGLDADAIGRPVRHLSGGQRRRVCLVRALAAVADGASLVVLDEPFSGIDREGLPELIALAGRHLAGRDVVLVSHEPPGAAVAAAWGRDPVLLELPA